MGQRIDRALLLCLWVVRSLCALTVLAILACAIYLLLPPRTTSPRKSPVAESADLPPAPTKPPAPKAAAPRRPALPELDEPQGTTPFVRRLEIGAELGRLRLDSERLGAGPAEVEARLSRLRPFLLHADLPRKGCPTTKRLLHLLTEPRRELDHFTLAGADVSDRLGSRLRVRAWTLGEPFPEDELDVATKLLEAIVRRAGHDVDGGIDVLITPGMGTDAFPFQGRPKNAIGVYFQIDRYCAVRENLPPWLRTEAVKHELVHAYCRHLPGGFTSSRLVSEGLAEYLRCVRPEDGDLDVPLRRLANQFAELEWMIALVRRAGVKVDDIQPARLVDLPPREFYALGYFGYLAGQAAMAYVGADIVERALVTGSDVELVDAVRRIEWLDFLRFVGMHGISGSIGQAVIVPDVGPEEGEDWPADRNAFGAALRWLGAETPRGDKGPDPKLAQGASGMPDVSDDRLLNALRLVLADERPVVFVTLAELDRPVTFAPFPAGVTDFLGPSPAEETLRGFASRVSALLAGDERLGELVRRRPTSYVARDASSTADRRAVLILGASDPRWLDEYPFAKLKPSELEVLLVIDLSEQAIGKAMVQAVDDTKCVVAYWRPIVDE